VSGRLESLSLANSVIARCPKDINEIEAPCAPYIGGKITALALACEDYIVVMPTRSFKAKFRSMQLRRDMTRPSELCTNDATAHRHLFSI
jgi:hypothetical protein